MAVPSQIHAYRPQLFGHIQFDIPPHLLGQVTPSAFPICVNGKNGPQKKDLAISVKSLGEKNVFLTDTIFTEKHIMKAASNLFFTLGRGMRAWHAPE